MFGQGFDTAKAFAKQHPDSPLAQGELGLSSHVLGSQMIADRRYQEAESSLIDATRLLEKVAYKTPHEYGYRDMLAAATTELGDLMRLTGRPEEAKEWYHRAENHWRKLVSDYPLRGYRFGLIGFLFARDRNDDAIKVLDDGVMVTQEAMRSHLEDPVLRGIHEKFCNSLAWHLVTAPSTQLHNPSKALALAEKAVKLAPNSGGNWNTLGIVQYRKGEWKAAADSLGKSMELRKGGDSSDWFFQAMVHWQLGDQDEARKWYDQAVGWMEKNAPNDEELRSIRAEAAELFGVK